MRSRSEPEETGWLLAAPLSDLAVVGDAHAFDTASACLLVVRTEDGILARHNVCQHRGHPILDRGPWRGKAMRCPYHGWTYDLRGRLLSVPEAESFGNLDGVALAAARCTAHGPFSWIHLGTDPPALELFDGTWHLCEAWVTDVPAAPPFTPGPTLANARVATTGDEAVVARAQPEDPACSTARGSTGHSMQLDLWRLSRDPTRPPQTRRGRVTDPGPAALLEAVGVPLP